jgi:hypothetical protein
MAANMSSRLLFGHVVALIVIPVAGCVFDVPDRFRETVEDPGSDFERQTGLAWPDNAEILSVDDTHGGFHGDGEFHVVFKTDAETIQEYIKGRAPFEGSWRNGPVPHEIGVHCNFGSEGVFVIGDSNGRTEYAGDSSLIGVLESDEVYFAAKDRGPESIQWHNGHLLVLDPTTNKVWLSVWDF